MPVHTLNTLIESRITVYDSLIAILDQSGISWQKARFFGKETGTPTYEIDVAWHKSVINENHYGEID